MAELEPSHETVRAPSSKPKRRRGKFVAFLSSGLWLLYFDLFTSIHGCSSSSDTSPPDGSVSDAVAVPDSHGERPDARTGTSKPDASEDKHPDAGPPLDGSTDSTIDDDAPSSDDAESSGDVENPIDAGHLADASVVDATTLPDAGSLVDGSALPDAQPPLVDGGDVPPPDASFHPDATFVDATFVDATFVDASF